MVDGKNFNQYLVILMTRSLANIIQEKAWVKLPILSNEFVTYDHMIPDMKGSLTKGLKKSAGKGFIKKEGSQ